VGNKRRILIANRLVEEGLIYVEQPQMADGAATEQQGDQQGQAMVSG